jgi:D-alanyl-D-alanine endopeptidase (penicillin-binding protein 7)
MFIRCVAIWFLLTSTAYATGTSYYVFNKTKNEVVTSEAENTKRPIASLTKLMTALVIVEAGTDLDKRVRYKGGIFFKRDVSVKELLESLLIKSDNAAGESLAESWPGGRVAFINSMNQRASSIGMKDTAFTDPSGLDQGNVSTAVDLSKLVKEALKYEIISKTSSSKFFKIEQRTKKKINYVSIGNTNRNLLFEFENIILSKTGFTNPAGRCLALAVEKNGNLYTIIILGEKTVIDREKRARHLINNYVTIYENF